MLKATQEKAQSTVEYILIVTAVIAVLAAFTSGAGSIFQQRLTNTMNTLSSQMTNAAAKMGNAH